VLPCGQPPSTKTGTECSYLQESRTYLVPNVSNGSRLVWNHDGVALAVGSNFAKSVKVLSYQHHLHDLA
jgi:hypothetical protein